MAYEMVMGLEVHVELATETKIFCSCTTKFGDEPNTHVCPVCMGMPGTLPVMNEKVLEYAVKAGLALNCEINRYNKFDRKNYFYPDLPKAYQISQLYIPFAHDGHVEIKKDNGKTTSIRIHEIHMEEDAGKLIHSPFDDETYPDYNRCGVPLIEIVSEPDFRTSEEVVSYLMKLKSTFEYLGISDCKMQEGSMRADVNLSVREVGSEKLGTRTEMKNINSFKGIEHAISFESKRQIDIIEHGDRVIQETRRWDDNKGRSFTMRSKENAQDYRYFPEPDIPPIEISTETLDEYRTCMPEMAAQKKNRYQRDYGLSEYDSEQLTGSKYIADLFEKTNGLCDNPKEIANWLIGTTMELMNTNGDLPEDLKIIPSKLSEFIDVVRKGKINRNIAKSIFIHVYDGEVDFDINKYIKDNNLSVVEDSDLIKETVLSVIRNNPKAVEDYRSGKEKAYGFLIGQTMKILKGKAKPETINSLMKKELESL